jgi:lipoprotein-anchoring transpeptidase ErfK/SrfK
MVSGRDRSVRRVGALAGAALLAAVLLAHGGGASAASGPRLAVAWKAPTPADGAAFTVAPGAQFTLTLAAAPGGGLADLVRLGTRGLPAGAGFTSVAGRTGTATVTWTPSASQVGEHVLTFTARTQAVYAKPRTFLVFVQPPGPRVETEPFPLNGPGGASRSASVLRAVAARAEPSASARVVTRVHTMTPEHVQNVVLLLAGRIDEHGRYWVRVRLPIRPNGSTGWIPRDALGAIRLVYTRLVIDRSLFTATLYRRGRAVFQTRVGVGKPFWPTPKGEFYVREKLTGFSDPIYGPLAFGTNARSNVLTDWLNGGFIGIHGTNQPEILPGQVSHGCVRMPNAAILRLAQLMPVGTPLTIT